MKKQLSILFSVLALWGLVSCNSSILEEQSSKNTVASIDNIEEASVIEKSESTPEPIEETQIEGFETLTKKLTTTLHEDLPEYTFFAYYEKRVDSPVTITVFKEGEELQTLYFELNIRTGIDVENLEKGVVSRWRVIDYNFDGYKDLICFSGMNEAREVVSTYTGWLFNPQTGLFDKTNIDIIPTLQIDTDFQALRGHEWGGVSYDYSIYRYLNGSFVKTNSLSLFDWVEALRDPITNELIYNYIGDESDPENLIILDGVKEYRNGELVEVFSDKLADTPEGQKKIAAYVLGENSAWFAPNGFLRTNGEYDPIKPNPENEDWIDYKVE